MLIVPFEFCKVKEEAAMRSPEKSILSISKQIWLLDVKRNRGFIIPSLFLNTGRKRVELGGLDHFDTRRGDIIRHFTFEIDISGSTMYICFSNKPSTSIRTFVWLRLNLENLSVMSLLNDAHVLFSFNPQSSSSVPFVKER